jgi:hypothetical protein
MRNQAFLYATAHIKHNKLRGIRGQNKPYRSAAYALFVRIFQTRNYTAKKLSLSAVNIFWK